MVWPEIDASPSVQIAPPARKLTVYWPADQGHSIIGHDDSA